MSTEIATPVYRIQGISSITDGVALTTVVLYFSHVVGLPVGSVGLALSASAAAALVLAAPLGLIADRVGLRTTAVAYSLAIAAAFGAYTVAHTLWAYAAAAVVFGVARAGIASTTQAIIAARLAPEQRVSARARLQVLLNAGFGVGSVIGAAVLAIGRPSLYVALYATCAIASAVCAVMFSGLRGLPGGPGGAPAGHDRHIRARSGAIRDPRLLGVTGLTAVMLLTMPILSVLLPVWLVSHTSAPAWVPAVAFALNTLLVVGLQSPWSARVRSDAEASRSAVIAGVVLAVACLLFGLVGLLPAAPAIALTLVGVAILTIGEVATGPAAWHLALRNTPADRQGEYQAVFGMSSSLARILGPLAALPLITGLGSVGWAVVAGAMLSAAGALATIGRAHQGPRQSRPGRKTRRRVRHRAAAPAALSAASLSVRCSWASGSSVPDDGGGRPSGQPAAE